MKFRVHTSHSWAFLHRSWVCQWCCSVLLPLLETFLVSQVEQCPILRLLYYRICFLSRGIMSVFCFHFPLLRNFFSLYRNISCCLVLFQEILSLSTGIMNVLFVPLCLGNFSSLLKYCTFFVALLAWNAMSICGNNVCFLYVFVNFCMQVVGKCTLVPYTCRVYWNWISQFD